MKKNNNTKRYCRKFEWLNGPTDGVRAKTLVALTVEFVEVPVSGGLEHQFGHISGSQETVNRHVHHQTHTRHTCSASNGKLTVSTPPHIHTYIQKHIYMISSWRSILSWPCSNSPI